MPFILIFIIIIFLFIIMIIRDKFSNISYELKDAKYEIENLRELLLSDPNEDTKLLNFFELTTNKSKTLILNGIKLHGKTYRDCLRGHVQLIEGLKQLPVSVYKEED